MNQRFEAEENALSDDFRVWDNEKQAIAITGLETKLDAIDAASRLNARDAE